MIKFIKGTKVGLSKNFSTGEFRCSCSNTDCITQLISEELVRKLQAVRDEFGAGLTVTSGFRCVKKQAQLRGEGVHTAVGTSTHELGQAADITPSSFSEDSMKRLLPILKKHFRAIGIAKNFYHVDLRSDRDRTWSY